MTGGEQITIIVGDEKHSVEGKPLTLICSSPNLHEPIEYPGRFMIDSDVSRYHAERCKKWHDHTSHLYHGVMGHYMEEGLHTNAQYHAAGLIDMSLKFMDAGIPVVWINPETFLHPAQCCELGELAVYMMRRYHDILEKDDD
jgi:hypothetical protein